MPAARVEVNFITYPCFDATILVDGELLADNQGHQLVTPCTADGLTARGHHVIFQHAGRPDIDCGRIDFSATRQVVGRWKTAGQAPGE